MKNHLVIVDGHHLMYRAYWAIPRTMKTASGEQVNTAFGVTSMLLQILKAEEPTHLLFCFDAGDTTFRHKEYAEYKSGRAETPDDFYVQIPRTLALIDAFGIASVSGKEHEADDFACTYAVAASKENFRTTIVSGDRDLFQLIDDSVRVAIPHKGYQAQEYLGPADVEKKYGVTPMQIASYKGLVGDSSDNLKGVNGIGPKAAASLLQSYGTLQGVYDHLPEIKESWRTKLEADRQQAFFCERMATLVCDIPLPLPLSALALEGKDVDPVLHLFSELEFGLLRRRFSSLLQTEYGKKCFRFDSSLLSSARAVSEGASVESTATAVREESPQMTLL